MQECPKNGSSALQSFFAKNIENLKHEGIDYPSFIDLISAKNDGITSGNGAMIARTLLDKNHLIYLNDSEVGLQSELIDFVLKSSCNRILISSEFFIVLIYPI